MGGRRPGERSQFAPDPPPLESDDPARRVEPWAVDAAAIALGLSPSAAC